MQIPTVDPSTGKFESTGEPIAALRRLGRLDSDGNPLFGVNAIPEFIDQVPNHSCPEFAPNMMIRVLTRQCFSAGLLCRKIELHRRRQLSARDQCTSVVLNYFLSFSQCFGILN